MASNYRNYSCHLHVLQKEKNLAKKLCPINHFLCHNEFSGTFTVGSLGNSHITAGKFAEDIIKQ